jgi:3-hydroxyacyl-CoA dehydrogenase
MSKINESTIKKVAVIGSGVMGSGIAAHIANSNTKVLLLDIVLPNASDRNQLVKGAIEKIKKADPAAITHPSKIKHIEIGNLEDDAKKLGECDWIIEVVLEDLTIKHNTYKIIEANRKNGSIVSSNTSTIPLNRLTDGFSEEFKKDFLVTHFFNPPRYMKLLELVTSEKTRKDAIETITEFCDVNLGKGVVVCNDTPGFIANRIGTFWIARAINEAIKQGTSVEVVDAVMSKPAGIPKTGVFGLIDLIGLDLLPLIAKSFSANLAADDEFNRIFALPENVQKLIADGYTGRKGKGGFYRLNPENPSAKIKEAFDLKTGEFRAVKKPRLASVENAKKSLRPLVEGSDEGAKFAWPVLRDLLVYTANLVGVIAKDIRDIDEAMKLGYNWKFGPFELIDKMADAQESGVAYFVKRLQADGIEVPKILAAANGQPLYKVENGERKYFTGSAYNAIPFNPDAFMLEEIKLKSKPILKNGSAALWDIGDGIACFEFTSKMNALDPMSLELLQKSIDKVKESYKGLVIANDSDNFCVGANIGVLLFAANVAAYTEIEAIIKQGQTTYMNLKYAPFPVVAAPSGMALGGGCEILLHSDDVVPHVELYSGLVEVGVGIVPGWGGCKEIIYRQLRARAKEDSVMAKFGAWFSWLSPIKTLNVFPPFKEAFVNISTAKVSKSAEEAKDMLIVDGLQNGAETGSGKITMNRKRLLADAKKRALALVPNYKAPEPFKVNLPGKTARTAIEMALKEYIKLGKVTPHDLTVSRAVAYILSGGETGITKEVTEQQLLDLEIQAFMKLARDKNTLARLEHMLETGKPLRN